MWKYGQRRYQYVAGGWANVTSGGFLQRGRRRSQCRQRIGSGRGWRGETILPAARTASPAGQQAQALHQGAFVWADSQSGVFASTTNDEFSVRASNSVRVATDKGIRLNNADRPIIVRDSGCLRHQRPQLKPALAAGLVHGMRES